MQSQFVVEFVNTCAHPNAKIFIFIYPKQKNQHVYINPFSMVAAFISWRSEPIHHTCGRADSCSCCCCFCKCAITDELCCDSAGIRLPNELNTMGDHIAQLSQTLTVLTWSIELHRMKRHNHAISDWLAVVTWTMLQYIKQSTNLY